MGDQYKSCELHGKAFPNNMVDTEKIDIARIYVERKENIEGKTVTLNLFMGNKSENEGFDSCEACLQEKLLTLLSEFGHPTWKGVSWHKETMTRKDGSGTYEKNVKTIKAVDEIALEIKEEKKKKGA